MPNKYSLHIGINYFNTRHELRGCINDTINMFQYLKENCGYLSENATFLNDNNSTSLHLQPTKLNILREMNIILLKAKPHDTLFIQYSGHGSYIQDTDGDEEDGKDECLCTSDNELITDDEINLMLRVLDKTVQCILLFDACHSGTNCDLPFTVNMKNRTIQRNRKYHLFQKNIIYLSGCRDAETSADAFIINQYAGAMTAHFLRALQKAGKNAKWIVIIQWLYHELKMSGFPQNPQISVCYPRQLFQQINM